MYHNIPSLVARSLLIRESLGESSQTIIITDGYETCKKLSKHLLDTSNTRAQIIDHPGIYKELILQVSGVYLATVDVFFQEVPDSKHIVNWTRHLKVGETHELEQLITWLTENGYHHDKDDSPHTYHTE